MSEQETETPQASDPNLIIKDESTNTTESDPERAPEAPTEAPKAPEPEECHFDAKGSFANGKGVMTAKNGCMDLERLQVLLVEQNGRTYEYSRMSVR